jgi:histidinol-phosphatase (PHP family)
MPASYHNHTPLCRHASGEPEEYVEAAIAAGVTEYGISDHAPQQPEPFDSWRMSEADWPDYVAWIERAKRHAAGRIPVRCGLECDWLPGNEAWIHELAARMDWDYLIGSVHYLGTWDFDNPDLVSLWNARDVDKVWAQYWAAYTQMAESGLFDILGHPDLVKKFGHRPVGDLSRFYEPAIDAIAAAGCAIELNTAGWHKPCAECYPSREFLELAASAGIPLVLSADAHVPDDVARDFPRAIDLARACGFRETLLFEARRRRVEPLTARRAGGEIPSP